MRMFIPLACLFLIPACGGDGGSSQATTTAVTSAPSGATRIGDIQGAGNISPLEGQVVTVSGTVTGDFQENDADERRNLGGFFIQDDPPDANPQTSDGIFVFDGNDPAADIDVGDVVEVEGTVVEYFGETQINAISVRVTGTGALVPFPIDLPINDATTNSDGDLIVDLEHLEGMLVTFTDTLTVTNLRNLERFGTVTLSEGGRLYQYTNYNSPDVDGYNAHKNLIARRSIVLDDGLRAENPSHIHYLKAGNTAGYSLRAGDNLTNLTGTLRYSRGAGGRGDETWRLMPTEDPTFESANPRPGAPSVGGSIRVASFNVLNYFSTVDSGQDNCGPEGESACRGADSDTEFARQLEKTVTALKMLDADIVGLMELENNANESISTIVDALNARIGSGDYSYIDTGTIHDDAIKTGFIYRETVVSPSGDFALLDRSVDSRFNDARNRPALAQTFSVNATAAELTVVVNHLKSKGSSCESDGDPNLGDGQGNCNLIRANAAAALADWIEGDPTGSGDADFLIIGDLNAYTSEDPLAAFENAGLTSLLGEQTNPYSFLFDAQSGALDHAVVSASLLPQVVATIEWHINADEPPLLDYNLEYGRDPALFDGSTPERPTTTLS
jgi:predicted extracellular nuclease